MNYMNFTENCANYERTLEMLKVCESNMYKSADYEMAHKIQAIADEIYKIKTDFENEEFKSLPQVHDLDLFGEADEA